MKITSNKGDGFLIMAAVTDQDRAFLRAVRAAGGKPGAMEYNSRRGADVGDPDSQRMELNYRMADGSLIVLRASDDESERHVRLFRDAQYLGGGYPLIAGTDDAGGDAPAKVCLQRCQHCQAPIVERSRCSFLVCEACVAKCEHEPVRGHVIGGGVALAEGTYCRKCGHGMGEVGHDFTPHLKAGGLLVGGGRFGSLHAFAPS